MENEKICSFFGHRDAKIDPYLFFATANQIAKAIKFGYRTFYFGGLGDFDRLAHHILTFLMRESPELGIRRVFCVPQERDLQKESRLYRRENYEEILYLVPSFDGWYKSIYFRNCAMIDRSDLVIFYAEERKDSGAYKAYKYAKTKKDKQIVNLWRSQHE